jgi:hypothetical protein
MHRYLERPELLGIRSKPAPGRVARRSRSGRDDHVDVINYVDSGAPSGGWHRVVAAAATALVCVAFALVPAAPGGPREASGPDRATSVSPYRTGPAAILVAVRR